MKKMVLLLAVGMLMGSNVYAGSGDLNVKGNAAVNGSVSAGGNVEVSGNFKKNGVNVIKCNFDGTWSYNDEGGGNDFSITCRNGVITGFCGAAAVGRGYHKGVYACEW